MRYSIRDSETGCIIDDFETLKEAEKAIESYEKADKEAGTYEEGFYEIYDNEKEEVVITWQSGAYIHIN